MHALVRIIEDAADPQAAEVLARYFQVRPGGYGEGDVFLGVKLGQLRTLAKSYHGREFQPAEWLGLLTSPVHEHRLVCLVVMSERALRLQRSGSYDAPEFTRLFDTYLANTASVNNWDLVDVSCGPLVGGYLRHRDRSVLDRLARSRVLWERRIAMVSTQQLIRAGESADVYRVAATLLHDEHDLMHKAVGWMLREAGHRVNLDELRSFLDRHATEMPRTMLRSSVERLDPAERQHYLHRR